MLQFVEPLMEKSTSADMMETAKALTSVETGNTSLWQWHYASYVCVESALEQLREAAIEGGELKNTSWQKRNWVSHHMHRRKSQFDVRDMNLLNKLNRRYSCAF